MDSIKQFLIVLIFVVFCCENISLAFGIDNMTPCFLNCGSSTDFGSTHNKLFAAVTRLDKPSICAPDVYDQFVLTPQFASSTMYFCCSLLNQISFSFGKSKDLVYFLEISVLPSGVTAFVQNELKLPDLKSFCSEISHFRLT